MLCLQKFCKYSTKNCFPKTQSNLFSPPGTLVCISYKDILNYNITIKFKALTLVYYYHRILRSHFSFASFPIMPFIAEGSNPKSCVEFSGHFSLLCFNLECFFGICLTFINWKGQLFHRMSRKVGLFGACLLLESGLAGLSQKSCCILIVLVTAFQFVPW